MATATADVNVQTANEILKHWQGHRALTRRVIDAFPEEKLFNFSVGGMRPFAEMAWEFIRMAVPIVDGVATGNWAEFKGTKPIGKSELLKLWDTQTLKLRAKGAWAEVATLAGSRYSPSGHVNGFLCGRGRDALGQRETRPRAQGDSGAKTAANVRRTAWALGFIFTNTSTSSAPAAPTTSST